MRLLEPFSELLGFDSVRWTILQLVLEHCRPVRIWSSLNSRLVAAQVSLSRSVHSAPQFPGPSQGHHARFPGVRPPPPGARHGPMALVGMPRPEFMPQFFPPPPQVQPCTQSNGRTNESDYFTSRCMHTIVLF